MGELVAQLGDVGDDADHPASDLQALEGLGDESEGVGIEGAESLVDEQAVEMHRTDGTLDLVAELQGESQRGQEGLPSAQRVADPRFAGVVVIDDPDFLVVARTDAFWLSRDLEDTIARLQAYAEAGADMVFPSVVGLAELAAVRSRVGKPVMVVDMPGAPLAAHEGAALVLFYGLSAYVHFDALGAALQRFKQSGTFTGRVREFEDFIGYEEFTRRAKKYE